MNSKAEFNRCEIARLSLEESKAGVDVGENSSTMEREVREWVTKRTNNKEGRVQVEKLRTATVPVKRGESDILESEDYLKTDQPKEKRKRIW